MKVRVREHVRVHSSDTFVPKSVLSHSGTYFIITNVHSGEKEEEVDEKDDDDDDDAGW